jgi:hypothetical protein
MRSMVEGACGAEARSDRQSKRDGPRPFHRPAGGPPSSLRGAGWERDAMRWRMIMLTLLPDLDLALSYRTAAIDIFALTPQSQSSRFASIHSAKCSSES